jgi:hypothetical protein
MELTNVKLKVYSDNRKNFEIDIDDIDWMLMEEPDISFTNEVSIQILGKTENKRKYKQVGIISGTYFNHSMYLDVLLSNQLKHIY